MQLFLPLFPRETKMISSCLGVYENDGIVQYIANGLPIYSHTSEDLQSFRFITSNFINQGLCKATEVARCFGISIDTVTRYLSKLRTEGEVAFFSEEKRKGYCHKIRGKVLTSIQKRLDEGQSVNSIARAEGLSEGSVRYAIKQGYLKKKVFEGEQTSSAVTTDTGSTYNERDKQNTEAPLGMATTRTFERGLAAVGLLQEALPLFTHQQSVDKAGVLFALPALIAQGLLKCKEVYQELSPGYYGLRSTILTLAFMALCRIKNPEQLKQQKVGELGSLLGLDRVPETRCLREKLQQIVTQHKAKDYNTLLLNHWLPGGDEFFFYIDGHVRIYYGNKANLSVKYISRQKLCLSATTEYWVNDEQGLPYLVFMGELNEKMQEVIEHQIIPELKAATEIAQRIADKKQLLFTLVFDRECYEPEFFHRLWDKHQIAVITYRKNVKDRWEENLFKQYDVQILSNTVTLLLCEQQVQLDGHAFREIRCLNEGGHQTAIITTNADITITQTASKMFCRWSQENFFKYLIADYDFDKMVQYGTQSIDENKKIVNPEYRKITYKIKKISEKIQRLEAKLYTIIEQVNNENLDHIPALSAQQIKTRDLIITLKNEKQIWVKQRVDIPNKIMLKEMPEAKRFNKLKPESKLFMNVIKMICYRAETALAEMAAPFFYKEKSEKRMLIKQLFNTPADLIPSEEEKTLTIKLSGLSAPRYNEAMTQLCSELNQTETIFPGTDLRLIFKN